jgi:hypothetical protein
LTVVVIPGSQSEAPEPLFRIQRERQRPRRIQSVIAVAGADRQVLGAALLRPSGAQVSRAGAALALDVVILEMMPAHLLQRQFRLRIGDTAAEKESRRSAGKDEPDHGRPPKDGRTMAQIGDDGD